MTQFSANLGFLWTELPLPDAVRAAKIAGFDAVECHSPFATDPQHLKAALAETGLRMLSLNTCRGNVDRGENGLCALPDRVGDARAAIDQALSYAIAIDVPKVHVMAGLAQGPDAHATYIENLCYACTAAAPYGITILIEPFNPYDAPGYFLQTTHQAVEIILQLGADNLKLLFDCYHVQRTEGDLSHKLVDLKDKIGHIQFSSVPDRSTPDQGEVNYAHIFAVIKAMGYDQPLGAEYKPQGPTERTLNWIRILNEEFVIRS